MKQLAGRAWLVVVLTLTSVGTASAECAWVLWQEHAMWATNLPREADWYLVGAIPSRLECEDELTVKVSTVLGRWSQDKLQGRKDEVERRTNIVTRTWEWPGKGLAGGETFRYLCLPDTIDPRGPKGAGR
jgi:hypothetical protein